ncbi:NAD(P)/FAD-dependent oxidoreductase [bacterium]|nr:NAD(P)/FAD-dependent oxidoreductase [bacterium]
MLDAAIIGAGPAGIAAAIQAVRSGLKIVVFEGSTPGGLIRNANWIENYPGFPNGISGKRFADLISEQLKAQNVKLITEKVQQINPNGNHFEIHSLSGILKSERIILATGTIPKKIIINGVELAENDNLFYEIVPLLQQTGKRIAVIGGGDAAFDYALNLARHNLVTIFHRGSKAKCLPLLLERVKRNARFEFHPESRLIGLMKMENSLDITIETKGRDIEMNFDYLVIAIGRRSNLACVSNLEYSQLEYYREKSLLYLVGDVKNGNHRHVGIAVGDGLKAAMQINEFKIRTFENNR